MKCVSECKGGGFTADVEMVAVHSKLILNKGTSTKRKIVYFQ